MERPVFLHAITSASDATDTHDARTSIADRNCRGALPHSGVASSRRSIRHVSLSKYGERAASQLWAAPAASAGGMQTQFLKNLGIMGGLLMIAVAGIRENEFVRPHGQTVQ
jgi:hypothetical protein